MEILETLQYFSELLKSLVLPVLGGAFLWSYKKRTEAAKTEKLEADNITMYAAEWKELYEKKEQRVEELDKKIDTLYDDLNALRKMNRELMERNTELTVRNGALEFRKCNRHGCSEREPPSEF